MLYQNRIRLWCRHQSSGWFSVVLLKAIEMQHQPHWGQSAFGSSDALVTFYSLTIMMTSSNGNIFRFTGHLCGEFTGALLFSFICFWINGWWTIVRLMIWDAIAPIMTPVSCDRTRKHVYEMQFNHEITSIDFLYSFIWLSKLNMLSISTLNDWIKLHTYFDLTFLRMDADSVKSRILSLKWNS